MEGTLCQLCWLELMYSIIYQLVYYEPTENGSLYFVLCCSRKQSDEVTLEKLRMETGSTSAQDEVEDLEQDNLVRHRSKRKSSGYVEPAKEVEAVDVSLASSTNPHDTSDNPQHNGNAFHSDEV